MSADKIKKFGFRPTTGLDLEDVFVEAKDGEYVQSSDYNELALKLAVAVRALENIRQRTLEPSYRMGTDINRIAEAGLNCAPEFHSFGKIGGDQSFACIEVKLGRKVASFHFDEAQLKQMISPEKALSDAARQAVGIAFTIQS